VSEFAMGPIDLAPVIEQGQDLLGLFGQDAVHRRSRRVRCRRACRGLCVPTTGGRGPRRAGHPAGMQDRPAEVDGLVDQFQPPGLGGRVCGRELVQQQAAVEGKDPDLNTWPNMSLVSVSRMTASSRYSSVLSRCDGSPIR
jgi:hypothetical protein